MKANELNQFDLSELTIRKKKLTSDEFNKLIVRMTKYKKPHYITAVERNKKQDRYLKAITNASKHAEPTKQLEVISKYLND